MRRRLVIYRAELSPKALRELHGFPRDAFKALTEAMGIVTENPYDPLRTLPTGDEQVRRVTFGDWGLATYVIIDSPPIVRVAHITWIG